ncbi:MAG TPA: hypothetical protein VFN78_05535 [Ktedonobacterales bacterium]|nr:hypothetical protein [Ktedonobacterales bacterium]
MSATLALDVGTMKPTMPLPQPRQAAGERVAAPPSAEIRYTGASVTLGAGAHHALAAPTM